MKTAMALALLFALSVSAQAKPAPVEPQAQTLVPSPDLTAIYTGPAGATIEHDYFQAPPQPSAAGRLFPCTVRILVFEKTRLAQACY